MNRYKSYPKCPQCEIKGTLVENGIRQCLVDRCSIRLYWIGGFIVRSSFSDPILEEEEFHFNKENLMTETFEKYFNRVGFA